MQMLHEETIYEHVRMWWIAGPENRKCSFNALCTWVHAWMQGGIDVYDYSINISPREYIQIKARSLPLHRLWYLVSRVLFAKGLN